MPNDDTQGEFPWRVLPSDTPHPVGLTAETEAEFAAALDQAVDGQPIYAPAEVFAQFGLDEECGPDSAEWHDNEQRAWLHLVPEPETR